MQNWDVSGIVSLVDFLSGLSRVLIMIFQKKSMHQISLQLLFDPGPGWFHGFVVCAIVQRKAMHLAQCFYVAIMFEFLISVYSL